MRAVRGRVPGEVHLRARRRQPARRAGVAGRALRLRLRDQLPALHPLRPLRRGVPHRGDHRDEALRVLVRPTARTRSTRRPSCSSTTTAAPGASRGSCGSAARTTTPARGCAPPRRRARPCYEGRVGWSGELGFGVRLPEAASRRPRTRASSPSPRRPSRWPASTPRTAATDDDRGHLLHLRRARAGRCRSAWCWRATRCTRRCSLVVTLVSVAVLLPPAARAPARRGAGDRLRGRDRRAVPVRDHAARRRPRGVARRPAPAPAARRDRARRHRPGRGDLPGRPQLGHRRTARPSSRSRAAAPPGGNVERVARVLFTDFLWPFEITAVLLVIAVVGGVVLARRSGQAGRDVDEEVDDDDGRRRRRRLGAGTATRWRRP